MKILVTGGSGFIGSFVVRSLVNDFDFQVINVDKLTYAGNKESLSDIDQSDNYTFENVDICDQKEINRVIFDYKPDKIMHLAAESHVDRSIFSPIEFIQTNIMGTFELLNASLQYWQEMSKSKKNKFVFHHISTDEVFGDAGKNGELFTEETKYEPSSPYSASKASSDHLVKAWHRTFGIPIVLSNCSNNYGPYQYPEKLIPLTIMNALHGKEIPIYGKGDQIRDWLYVEDHVKALVKVMNEGTIGDSYNIGGHNEITNLEVVKTICDILDALVPTKKSYNELIRFVTDRPGHDTRYAIDASKIHRELNWKPDESFESGIKKTVKWYLENGDWWTKIVNKK